MDSIKIDNFRREYPDKIFPLYKTLSIIEAENIAEIFSAHLKLVSDSSSLDLVKVVAEKSSRIPDVCAESDEFSLKDTIIKAGISPKEKVFINWYRVDQIDEISLDELSIYFNDIWYPAADHIDIFDDSYSWLLSIGYAGEITFMKLARIDPKK